MDKCLICSKKIEEVLIKDTLYYHCLHCDFLFKKNRELDKDVEMKRYNLHIIDDGYKKYMYQIFLNIKDDLISGNSLDFGCGKIHLLSDILNENMYKCYYYDKYYYKNYPLNNYKNIIMIEVIEHLFDPLKTLETLLSNLSSDGQFIIMTKLHDNTLNPSWYFNDVTHISFFTLKTFKVIAQILGFKIKYLKNENIIFLKRIKYDGDNIDNTYSEK